MSAETGTGTAKGEHKYRLGRKADYQGTMPERVAEAILRHRPNKRAEAEPTQKR